MSSARRSPLWISAAFLVASVAPAGAEPPSDDAPALGPEILHVPLLERRAEQGILRPVPIRVVLPPELALRARRVLVHYRLWGEPDFVTLELRRAGARFEGAVPCREVSTVTGDLRYYIRVHDVEGRVIATGASRVAPYRVTIRHDTALDPGARRAAKCPDPADCPAGLSGCPSETVREIPCEADRDCESGMRCGWRGVCERTGRRLTWLSLGMEQGVGVIATSGACSLPAQEQEGYACYRADGEHYAGNPVLTNEPLGVGLAPTRLVAGIERLIAEDTTVALRLAWVVRGEGPTPRRGTPFVPFSAAARAAHWFGADPFARTGVRPFVHLSAGFGMADVRATTRVREDPTRPSLQGGNDLEQTVTVWKRAGDAFVGVGGGVAVALSLAHSVVVEAAVVEVFPFGAVVVTPTASFSSGF